MTKKKAEQAVFRPVFPQRSPRAGKGVARCGTAAVGLCLMAVSNVTYAQDLTWGVAGDGTWNFADTNWTAIATDPPVAFSNDLSVLFDEVGPITVTLDSSSVRTPGITFAETGYVIAQSGGGTPFAIEPTGGALSLALSPNVAAEVSAPFTGAGTITATGDATTVLTLSGDSSGATTLLDIASGQVILDGDYGGAVTNSGDGLTNNATITGLVTNNASLTAAGTFSGGITNDAGTVTVTADSAGDVMNTGGDLNINVGQTLTGSITNADADSDTVNDGDVVGDLTVSAGTVDNNGTITGNTSVSGGTVSNDGTLSGTVTMTDGSVTNNDTVTGNVAINGGTFTNTADLGGTVTVDATGLVGATFDDTGGTITGLVTNVDGTITADGTTFTGGIQQDGGTATVTGVDFGTGLTVSGGTVAVSGATVATTTGNATLSGGDLTVDAGQTLSGSITSSDTDSDTVINGDVIGDLTVSAGTVDNNGTVTGNTSVSGGAVTNDGMLSGTVTMTDGSVTNNDTITGDVAINGGTLTNTGDLNGTVTVDETGLVDAEFDDTGGTIAGLVTNVDGTITADGTTFTDGVQHDGGTATVTGTDFGAGLTVAGGSVTVSGATAATTTGDATLTGGDLTVEAGQTLTGAQVIDDTGSRLRNDGTIVGNVTLNAGSFDNNATLTGNVTHTDGNLFGDDGTISGTVTQSGGASIYNQSEIAGGLTISDGRTTIRGDTVSDVSNTGGIVVVEAGQTLTGDLDQTDGLTRIEGTIDGAVIGQGGRINHEAGADITGLTALQNGVEFNALGGTFTGGLRVEDADLSLTGPLVGDLENAGEDLVFGDGVVLDGDVVNSAGTMELGADVTGTLTVDGGSVETTPTLTVQGATSVNDGALDVTEGAFDGGIRVAGGDVTIKEVGTIDSLVISDGTLEVGGATALASDLDVSGGATTLTTDTDGDVTQSGGTVANTGGISGTVSLSDGTFTHSAGEIAGATTVSGGTLVAGGGDFGTTVTNQGGTVRVTGASNGDVNNLSGEFIAESGGVLTGSITNEGTVTGAGGSVTGDLVNSGIIDVTGGDLTVGNLTSTGDVSVSGGNTLGFGEADFDGGSLAVTNGILDGDVTAGTGTAINAANMSITGDLTNAADLLSNGSLNIGGDFAMIGGDLTIATGAAQIDGNVTIGSGLAVALQDGTSLTGQAISNAGNMTTTGTVSVSGDFVNSGTLSANGTQDFDGTFTNTGTLTTDGDLSFAGQFTNSGVFGASGSLQFASGLRNTSTIDVVNNDPTDRITIGGTGLTGGGTLQFDVDLSNEVGAADRITMAPEAFVTGEVTLNFNVLGSGAQQPADLVLIDLAAGDPGNFTISADEIIDPSGILTYSVTRNAAGNIVIEDALTPGIAGLAGNIVLTQSLIGSVVNRPSSPFVTSLAYEDEDPCGAGLWARSIGGGATSVGEVSEIGLEGGAFDGRISATFAGVQMGGDFACFNGAYRGWDLAFGSIGGVNIGQTSQPVFAIDLEVDGNLSDLQTSTTTVDFMQLYAGAYATAVRGPWAVDLQYRIEKTDFTATNEGADGLPGLGLDETNFSSSATTLSGAASYVYNIPDTNMALVPTAGFAFTDVSTDPINFASRGTVRIDDFDSRIGFFGGTLAVSNFGDDGVSAYQEFVSATVYNDFADGPTSTFSPVDESGDRRLRTENLGLYGELSVGVNYVKVLQQGEFGAVKQLSANARADVRVSQRLKSWGITAQARYQF